MSEINKSSGFMQWLQNTFFPIEKEERPRVLSLAIMFTAIVFIYTVLRQVKDVLIMNIGGSSVIPPAKVVVMIVAAFLGMQHSKISKKYSHKKAFLISFIPFVGFFLLFSVLFKRTDILHANPETIKLLSVQIPPLKYFFIVFGNWLASSYYVFAEMFGSFILSVSAWQLINFYSTHEQSKRVYPFFGLCAQIGNYGGGHIMVVIGGIFKANKNLDEFVFLVTSAIMISSVVVLCGLLYFFNIALKRHKSDNSQSTEKKSKVKVTWKESVASLKEHPALLLVAFLSVWYGLCATSIEVYWKGKVFSYYGIEGYTIFMGQYQKAIAVTSSCMVIFGSQLIRRLPWIMPAIVTPIVVMLSATAVFGMSTQFLQRTVIALFDLSQERVLYIIVMIGCVSLVFFKAAKYTLFDPTKEMFTRSRSKDDAIKIKALETFVGRFGKGGSSLLQTFLIAVLGFTVDSLGPLLWVFVMTMASIWSGSIVGPLNKEMKLVEAKSQKASEL